MTPVVPAAAVERAVVAEADNRPAVHRSAVVEKPVPETAVIASAAADKGKVAFKCLVAKGRAAAGGKAEFKFPAAAEYLAVQD